MKKIFKIIIPVIVVFLLGGCAKYRVQPLNRLMATSFNDDEQSVSFAYKIFNLNDCKRFLDRNVLAKGYQPIQITIVNNSNKYINFSRSGFSLPYVSAEEISKKVHTSTLGRAAGYGIGSLFLWPLAIPAVVDGVKSSNANSKLDEDFIRKELSDQIISPFTSINGLIFVSKEEFTSEFRITLVDSRNSKKIELSTNNSTMKIK